MKKYLLGLFAVVLALGFSAFTKVQNAPKGKSALTTFYFQGVVGDLADLQVRSNWIEEDPSQNCIAEDAIPCQVTFTEGDIEDLRDYAENLTSVDLSQSDIDVVTTKE